LCESHDEYFTPPAYFGNPKPPAIPVSPIIGIATAHTCGKLPRKP
jgi:hypothetical protein